MYSQSVHALALNAGLMDNDAGRYCTCHLQALLACLFYNHWPRELWISYFCKSLVVKLDQFSNEVLFFILEVSSIAITRY